MSTRHFTMIDLFCGTGGFAQGFLGRSPRFRLVYGIDMDPEASQTARANHGNALIETADIRQRTPKAVADRLGLKSVDVIIGGPPCQGYSSLRPNRSSELEDERNDLYLRFAAYVAYFRPQVVVLENVVGLLTHAQGQTLERLLSTFASLRYRIEWRLVNAANFGVPQKRERFIMIGARDGGSVEFPTPTHQFSGKVIGYRDKGRYLTVPRGAPDALTVSDAISDLPPLSRGEEATRYDQGPRNGYQRARRAGATMLTLHRAARHNDKMLRVMQHAGESIRSIPSHLVGSGFSSCYSRLAPDEPATTITVKFQSPASNKCIHPDQMRTLTPREAARLQSFDDTYVFTGSLTSIASQLGNAVPPLLGRAIAGATIRMLSA